ncbi:MAG: LamB/YcsF family protein [Gammaproteobacteria bacterium]|nr:MAG: LamB/YcsF family protein [Gammaproteobacteria bacterium]
MPLWLNADLGEGAGGIDLDVDAAVMPHIHQANIACGFHAGDQMSMRRTLQLASQHGVMIGAHPGYRDLEGFGRRSMSHTPEEIAALLHYQIAALDGMARSLGMELEYVKPHGALYNDMMRHEPVRRAVMEAVASFYQPLHLMIQATPQAEKHRQEAEQMGVPLWLEAFADRCYEDNGLLVPRTQPGAVHSREQTLAQVASLVEKGEIITAGGLRLPLAADTICVHGDNPDSIRVIRELRQLVS